MSEPKKNNSTGLWEVDFRLNGKHSPRVQRTGKKGFGNKQEALAWMKEKQMAFYQGIDEKKPAVATYGFCSDRYYREHVELHCRNPHKVMLDLEFVKDLLGASTPLSQIDEQRIVQFQKEMKMREGVRGRAQVRNSTINRRLGMVDTVMGRAKRWGYIKSNPCEYVKRLEEDEVTPRFLSEEEIKRLFDAAPTERCHDYMFLAYKTGIRPINLRTMKMSQVYLEERVILVPKFKKKNSTYAVPIDDEMYAWFKKKNLRPNDLVLNMANHDREVEFAINSSGINEGKSGDDLFTIYGLKHCYASHLIMNGATTFEVAQLLGHTDTQMVEKHYGFLTKKYLANVASKVRAPAYIPSVPQRAPVPPKPRISVPSLELCLN